MTVDNFVKGYLDTAFTHNYIMGYIIDNTVYFTYVYGETVLDYLSNGKASSSKGGGRTIRYRPNKEQKNTLYNANHTALCDATAFLEMVAESKYNKGEVFEKLITEYFNQDWKKDSLSWDVAPDLWIKNTPYQIKFQEATFCTERNLRNRGIAI